MAISRVLITLALATACSAAAVNVQHHVNPEIEKDFVGIQFGENSR